MSYIGAIDLGTTGVRFVVFDQTGVPVGAAYRELSLSFPHPGWVEQNPEELLNQTIGVMREALAKNKIEPGKLAGIGITNQRETTIVWDKRTGKPAYPAIVWQDRRTAARCATIQGENWISERTGLRTDPYFSGTKLEWILKTHPELQALARSGELLFGTPDAWLIWNLTGVHATDPTNASRTLLFDIKKRRWDEGLCRFFSIPCECLPEVRPSISSFGRLKPEVIGESVPVAGVLGDQQAALFGQFGFDQGAAKVTWGTGAFLLLNIGDKPVISRHSLLTTIAYATESSVAYALEGSAFVAGAVIQWLRDELGLIANAGETDAIARTVSSTDGVYFVPAFAGLGAPYWDPTARGTIIGLTRGTTRAQLVRAALEGIAYETHDLVRAMEEDAGSQLTELRVDGGAARNDFLCQFQADILGIPVVRPKNLETTARGAAFAAGLGVGFWDGLDELKRLPRAKEQFVPQMDESTRTRLLSGWHRAVERAKEWTK